MKALGPRHARWGRRTPGISSWYPKATLDLGYSALARDVEHEYRTTMIDRALETMEQNTQVAGPDEQFVWTIPGWPMQTILWDGQNPARKRRIEAALQRGNLVIHALPYTIETGSANVETLARSFIYSSRIAVATACRCPAMPR